MKELAYGVFFNVMAADHTCQRNHGAEHRHRVPGRHQGHDGRDRRIKNSTQNHVILPPFRADQHLPTNASLRQNCGFTDSNAVGEPVRLSFRYVWLATYLRKEARRCNLLGTPPAPRSSDQRSYFLSKFPHV